MIVGVLATLVSLYYYLGIVRAMYMRPSEELQMRPGGGVAVTGGAPRRRPSFTWRSAPRWSSPSGRSSPSSR